MIDIGTRISTEGELTHIERVQDCTPIAEYAKALHNAGQHGSSEFKHAACIPNVIIEKYCNDKNIDFSEFMRNREHMRAILNDPSLKAFRIWPGAV